MLDVFLAGPHHLDRPVDLLGDAHRRDHHVGLELAAEAAAEQLVVDGDLVDRQAGRLRRLRLHPRHDLGAGPDLAGVRLEMNRAVHRLHRRMRQERQLVGRLEPVAGRKALGDIAVGFRDHAVLFAGGAQILPDVFRADAARSAPSSQLIIERIEALLGRPHVIADHRDQIVQHDDLLHARDFLGGAVVDLADLAAEHRACRQGRELHAGQHRVDAVDGLAVDLVRRVEALQRLADQHEVLRVLERDVLRRRLAARAQRPARRRQACARSPCGSPRRSRSCSLPARPAIACAAACTSMARALAPALRSGVQNARIELELPVAWMPKVGLP